MNLNDEELRAVADIALEPGPRYWALEGTYSVVPKERLRAAGWRVNKSMRPVTQCVPDTWVDSETGEIFTKAEARKLRIKLPVGRSPSDKVLDMSEHLAACTPGERPFVAFLLNMRNHRGGLIAPLESLLDRWIGLTCPGIRSTNRARKRDQLRAIIKRRNLMANETTMAKRLMLLNPNMTKQAVIEEGIKRYNLRYLPIKSQSEGIARDR